MTSSNSKQKYRRSKIKKITVKKCISHYLQGICTDSSEHHLEPVVMLLPLMLVWFWKSPNLAPARALLSSSDCSPIRYILLNLIYLLSHYFCQNQTFFQKKFLHTWCINTWSVLAEGYPVTGSLYIILNTRLHQLGMSIEFVKKDQRFFYTNYFDLEQLNTAPLPQAGHLLFIDKVREQKMVFCYEETVYYWFSNLRTGRERRQKYISNANPLRIFAFCLLNTTKCHNIHSLFFPTFERVMVQGKFSFHQIFL